MWNMFDSKNPKGIVHGMCVCVYVCIYKLVFKYGKNLFATFEIILNNFKQF